MTEPEAQQIIGIDNNASFAEAKQAYEDMLQKLRLKMLAGNHRTKRLQAEREIARLLTAWQTLNKTYSAKGHQQPASQYAAQTISPGTYASSNPLFPKYEQIFGILIACFFMLVIIGMNLNSYVSNKKKLMAQLRVLSVPWCNVKIDGKFIGQSGQPEAFKIIEGKRNLTFESDGNLLTESIDVKRGKSILVKVDFSWRKVYVSQE